MPVYKLKVKANACARVYLIKSFSYSETNVEMDVVQNSKNTFVKIILKHTDHNLT